MSKINQACALPGGYAAYMERHTDPDRLREFIDLILSSLDDDVDGGDIASRAFLSRYHFDRLISAGTGEAPGALRRRLLLERAAWELRQSRVSILRVAIGAGYRSVEGFTRAFGRAFESSPGRYRHSAIDFRLQAPNGVHFHPPGGITLPTVTGRSTRMDFVDRIIEHDLWFTNRLLDQAGALPEQALDQPVLRDQGSRLWEEGDVTLRELLNDMVANKEMWSASLAGRTAPHGGGEGIDAMKLRLATAGAEFARQIRGIRDRDEWDGGFVDTTCDPPLSFTYGGMLAHVATFSAYRRTRAILALRELGAPEVGIGDPVEWERALAS